MVAIYGDLGVSMFRRVGRLVHLGDDFVKNVKFLRRKKIGKRYARKFKSSKRTTNCECVRNTKITGNEKEENARY